jgi:hypothetical protein
MTNILHISYIDRINMSSFDISSILDISKININTDSIFVPIQNSEPMQIDLDPIYIECQHNWINFCTIDKSYSIQLYFGICTTCANIKAVYNCSYKKKLHFTEYDTFTDSDELLLEDFYKQIYEMTYIECLSLDDYKDISKCLIITLTTLFRYHYKYYYMIKQLETKFN